MEDQRRPSLSIAWGVQRLHDGPDMAEGSCLKLELSELFSRQHFQFGTSPRTPIKLWNQGAWLFESMVFTHF